MVALSATPVGSWQLVVGIHVDVDVHIHVDLCTASNLLTITLNSLNRI